MLKVEQIDSFLWFFIEIVIVYFWEKLNKSGYSSLWLCFNSLFDHLMKARGAERDELHSFIQAYLLLDTFCFFPRIFVAIFYHFWKTCHHFSASLDLSFSSIISRMIFSWSIYLVGWKWANILCKHPEGSAGYNTHRLNLEFRHSLEVTTNFKMFHSRKLNVKAEIKFRAEI